MTKSKNILLLASASFVVLTSGCATDVSNDKTHQAITKVKPVYFKPVFEISDKKITGKGEAGGFFNFDFSTPSFSIPNFGASNTSAFVEPSLFDGLTATEAEALRDAIFNACEANHAEYLLTPHFKIRTRSFPLLHFIWSKSYCSIYGIPAKVKEVIPVEEKEEKNLDMQLSATVKTEETAK